MQSLSITSSSESFFSSLLPSSKSNFLFYKCNVVKLLNAFMNCCDGAKYLSTTLELSGQIPIALNLACILFAVMPSVDQQRPNALKFALLHLALCFLIIKYF